MNFTNFLFHFPIIFQDLIAFIVSSKMMLPVCTECRLSYTVNSLSSHWGLIVFNHFRGGIIVAGDLIEREA